MLNAIFVLFGGLLVPRLGESILCQFGADIAEVRQSGVRNRILDLAENMEIGRIAWAVFVRECGSVLGQEFHPVEDGSRIRSAYPVDLQALAVLRELAQLHALWLLSDYPLPLLTQILSTIDGPSIFGERILVIGSLGLQKCDANLFLRIPLLANAKPEECLLISGQQRITSKCIRAGISAIQYVSPIRLRRELIVRKIAVQPQEEKGLVRL